MTKRIQDEIQQLKCNDRELAFSFGTLVITLMCSFLIVIATFTQIKFNYSWLGLRGAAAHYSYIAQVPVIAFIATLLGRKFGLLSVLLYIICGLFFPIYALGGGLHYILEYSFGYILAYIPGVFIAAWILSKECSFRSIVFAALACVLVIHLTGMFYLLLVLIIRHESMSYAYDFLVLQNGLKIVYDFIISIFAVYLARLTKQILWLAIGN